MDMDLRIKKLISAKWLPVVLLACISLIISFWLMRGLFYSKGLLEAGDLNINYYMKVEKDRLFSLWDRHFGFDYTINSIERPSNFWFAFIKGSEAAQRIRYFILFFLSFFNLSIAAHYFLSRRFGRKISILSGLAAGAIFVFSPWYISRLPHYHLLWGYSMTPLVFYFSYLAFQANPARGTARNSLLAGIFIAFSLGHHMIAFNAALALSFALAALLFDFNSRGLRTNTLKLLIFTGSLFIETVLLCAYWLLPYSLFFSQGHSLETLSLFRTLDTTSQNTPYQFIIGLVPGKEWSSYILETLPSGLKAIQPISRYLFFFLIFAAFFATFIKVYKNKAVRFLFFASIFLILFIRGANGLLARFYLWVVFSAPLLSTKGALLRDLTKLTGFLAFFYAMITGYLMASLMDYAVRAGARQGSPGKLLLIRSGFFIFLSSVIVAVLLNGWLILVDIYPGKRMPLVKLPMQYQQINSWLDRQGRDYKVVWLPYDATNASWSPYNEFQGNLTDLNRWATATPVFGTSNMAVAYPATRILESYIAGILNTRADPSIAKLYRLTNTRFVIFRNDTHDPSKFKHTLENLENSTYLKKVFGNDYFTVFEYKDYPGLFSAFKRINLVAGGLDILEPLCNIEEFYPDRHPLVFLERGRLDARVVLRLMDYCGNLFFYGAKDINDLTLDLLARKYLVFPAEAVKYTFPLSGWDKYSYDGHLWTTTMLARFPEGNRYDFDLGRSFLISVYNGTKIDFNHHLDKRGEEYELWVRTLKSPEAGEVRFEFDRVLELGLNSYSPYLEGFKWERLGSIFKKEKRLHCQIESLSGWNVINALAIVPQGEYSGFKEEIEKKISDRSIRTVNIIKSFPVKEKVFLKELITQEWAVGMGEAKIQRSSGGSYLMVQGRTHKNGLFAIYPKDGITPAIRQADILEFELKVDRLPRYLEGFELKLWDAKDNFRIWQLSRPVRSAWQRYKVDFDSGYYRQTPDFYPGEIDRIELLAVFKRKQKFNFFLKDRFSLYTKSADVPAHLAILRPDLYIVAVPGIKNRGLKAAGSFIKIDNSDIPLLASREEGDYYGPVKLKEGKHAISYPDFRGASFILYPAKDKFDLRYIIDDDKLDAIRRQESLSNTEYTMQTKAPPPFIIGFTEGFSRYWQVYDKHYNLTLHSFPLNLIGNGFLLPAADKIQDIRVSYLPQGLFLIGVFISCVSVIVIVVFIFKFSRKE